MQPTNENQETCGAPRRFLPRIAAALILFGSVGFGQEAVDAKPFGAPSECAPGGSAALGLYLVRLDGGAFALRLEGGRPGGPAALMYGTENAQSALPGGGTMLVGGMLNGVAGRFDAQGVLLHPLDAARFDADTDALFVQGIEPPSAAGRNGMELSGALELTRRAAPVAPPSREPQLPEVIVEEFAGFLEGGHLEAALDLALNSDGDAIQLDIGGNLEVPVYPGITAGGKAAFKAGIKRGENGAVAVVYDLTIGSDVAASAGVGAGVVGAGASAGVGGEVIWRFASTHEVVRALRSMAVLQAVGPQLETAALLVHDKLHEIDRAVRAARGLADRLRRAARSWMPWSGNALVRRLNARIDALRQARRALADRARNTLGQVISWVAEARIFLNEHAHGFEARMTKAVEVSAGTGIGDSKNGGQYTIANLGASVAAGIERQFAVRTERVEESDALAVESKLVFTKSITGAAGFGIGGVASAKRVLEVSQKVQFAADGIQVGESGTTVKVTLDGRVLGALGVVATAQFGVGGEVVAELRLRDLIDYSADAIAIVLSDDTGQVVRLLRAVPVRFLVRGRYEAGLGIGFGVDLDGVFKAGLGGTAMLSDCGPGFEYEGCPEGNRLTDLLTAGPLRGDDAGAQATFATVRDEVTRVAQR